MKDTFYIAGQYLRYHWVKTVILVVSVSLVLFIPLGLNYLAKQGAQQMTSRAEATPLLVGAKGSQTELSLSALYLKEPKVEPIPYQATERLSAEGLAVAIPMHLRYKVRSQPIVGTTAEYFDFRQLSLQAGRRMAMLGECVLGAEAARVLQAEVGASVISSPAGAFDIAGSFPLKMPVVGILAPTGTPDDQAVFVDIKTSWVISGLAHGHQDISPKTADSLLLSKDSMQAVASAAVLAYTEITPENRDSFHFHGDPAQYPVDVIIAIPEDQRASLMLRGRYENAADNLQVVVPMEVISELLGTLFSVRDLLMLAALSIGLATLVIAALVFVLSFRLRTGEISTMRRIGGAESRIRQILGLEIGIIAGLSVVLAGVFTFLLSHFGLHFIEHFIT